MNQRTNRREFLRTSTAATLGLAGTALLPGIAEAIEPFKRLGSPKMMLSLAAYSFREFFTEANRARKQPADPAKQIDLFQFVDFCADHNCAAELTSYYFPANVTDDFLLKLRRHAFLRGVPISGSAVGNTFTDPAKRDAEVASVKKWIDRAALLGAPHIRIFAGAAPKSMPMEEAKKLCIAATEECCDYAGKKGVFLGLENHGGIVAEPADLLEMVRAVKSPWFGVNLDTGNFHTDDPYRDLELCASYAVNVQFKAEIHRRGQAKAEPAEMQRVIKILRDANYQGYVALEYESAEDPWKAVPRLLGEMRKVLNT